MTYQIGVHPNLTSGEGPVWNVRQGCLTHFLTVVSKGLRACLTALGLYGIKWTTNRIRPSQQRGSEP